MLFTSAKPASPFNLDLEGDPIGLIIEKEFICGYCNHEMEEVSNNHFVCPKCGFKFTAKCS